MNQLALEPQPSSEYRIIALTQEQVAIVDSIDYETLAIHNWSAKWCEETKSFYACRHGSKSSGYATIYMHRQIINKEVKEVDHHNGDTLDNRRNNLRAANHSQNQHNRRILSTNTSGYRGVSWSKARKLWVANIRIKGKKAYLGAFTTAKEASTMYEEKAKSLRGEFHPPVRTAMHKIRPPCESIGVRSRKYANNKSGYMGVTLHSCGRWRATFILSGKQKSLGYFSTPEEASVVYEDFAAKHRPQH